MIPKENKPKIVGGICEFCGVPAHSCFHYRGRVDVDGKFLDGTLQKSNIKSPAPEEINIPLHREYKKRKLDFSKDKIADIIIPHHDRHDHLNNLLEILPNDRFNIIVVSGGSFAQNCNRGAKAAITDKIIFLNDDTLPTEEDLNKLVDDLDQYPVVGCAQKIPNTEEILYGVGFYYKESNLKAKLLSDSSAIHFPAGFLICIKTKLFNKYKFDEKFINGGEDSDLFFRLITDGHEIYIDDEVIIPHYHGQSEGRLAYASENGEYLNKKWSHKKIEKLFNLSGASLKILIACNHLANYAGSETFNYTLAKVLSSKGHNVDVFTLNTGMVSEDLGELMVEKPADKYDLIIISHNPVVTALKEVKGFKVLVCHGVYPRLEQPVPGADAYVAISEEVQTHLKSLNYESIVIRNPIDLKRFNLEIPVVNEKLKKVLCLAKNETAINITKKACENLGVEFEHVTGIYDIENVINNADIVVTLGRGAMEAMACGRQVIVYDTRQYTEHKTSDGIVTKRNISKIIKSNLSGRAYKYKMTVENMERLLKKYDRNQSIEMVEIAKEYFDADKIIDQYLDFFESEIKNKMTMTQYV